MGGVTHKDEIRAKCSEMLTCSGFRDSVKKNLLEIITLATVALGKCVVSAFIKLLQVLIINSAPQWKLTILRCFTSPTRRLEPTYWYTQSGSCVGIAIQITRNFMGPISFLFVLKAATLTVALATQCVKLYKELRK